MRELVVLVLLAIMFVAASFLPRHDDHTSGYSTADRAAMNTLIERNAK